MTMTMNAQLLNRMIGVPFAEQGRDLSGFDCWGVVRYGLRHGFGVEVPSFTEDYVTTQDGAEISALIRRESPSWPEVPLMEAQAGDVLILRIHGQPWHCGLVINPPHFVHADRGLGTVLA
jgi:cell wall-associated NlpC family hydrolase